MTVFLGLKSGRIRPPVPTSDTPPWTQPRRTPFLTQNHSISFSCNSDLSELWPALGQQINQVQRIFHVHHSYPEIAQLYMYSIHTRTMYSKHLQNMTKPSNLSLMDLT